MYYSCKDNQSFSLSSTTGVPGAGKMSKTPLGANWISGNIGEDTEFIYKKYGLKKEGAE
jgi:hypothetical protein